MNCVRPPELKDRELLAYIDGEARGAVEEHLRDCPSCQARARQLARLQARLSARLYRVECPPPHELGEYHLGLLSPERAREVAGHLDGCFRCAREMAQLTDYLRALEPSLAEQARDRIRVVVARLVEGWEALQAPAPALRPALAGLRGEHTGPRVYEANEIQVVLEVQADASQPDRASLLGLALGVDPAATEAHLWQAGQRVAGTALDELGNLVIGGLLPGRYELILTGPDLDVRIQDLDISLG